MMLGGSLGDTPMGQRADDIKDSAGRFVVLLSTLAEDGLESITLLGRVGSAIASVPDNAVAEFVDRAVEEMDADARKLENSKAQLEAFRHSWASRHPKWRREFVGYMRTHRHKILADLVNRGPT
jgi:hypothetical protein